MRQGLTEMSGKHQAVVDLEAEVPDLDIVVQVTNPALFPRSDIDELIP
jgi:hypothetical protein